MMTRKTPGATDFIALGMVSCGLIAFEILLLRVFTFSQWHHFASLAVSLALLGFGAAGTVLSLLGGRQDTPEGGKAAGLLDLHGDMLAAWALLLAAAGIVFTFLLNQVIVVRPLFIVHDPSQLVKLLLLDFSAFIPFFCGALYIGHVFMRWPPETSRLYAVNLFGSGSGALLVALTLSVMSIRASIILMAGFIGVAAVWFAVRHAVRVPAALASVFLCGLVLWPTAGNIPSLRILDFKQLSYLLDLPDAEVLRQDHGLRSMVTEVRSDSIRVASGLSLNWFEPIPSQDALVIDADRMVAMPRNPEVDRGYREAMLTSLPLEVVKEPAIAVLGTGESGPLLQKGVTWIESDPNIVRAFEWRGLTGLLDEARVEDPRHFLSATDRRFGLIHFASPANGGDAMSEETLLTEEAVHAALRRLEEDGYLAIPFQLSNPPRYLPKAMQLARGALGEEASERVMIFRSMHLSLMIIGKSAITGDNAEKLKERAERWGFDLVWSSGMTAEQANRFHQLEEPLYFETAQALFSGEDSPPQAARFYNLRGATDLRPYFWHSVRWSAVPELLRKLGRQGLMYVDWGALLMGATLLAAAILAALLILAPLGRLPTFVGPQTRGRTVLYFGALGLGYLTVEIALLQRAALILGHPVIAATLVFTVFLIGSGLGSLTTRSSPAKRNVRVIYGTVGAAFLVCVCILLFAGHAFLQLSAIPRMILLVCIAAPLAFAMGRPFPWGLHQVGNQRPVIPWAWGINGFTSVIAAPMASIVSVEVSQLATWGLGALCYLIAWRVARTWAT